MQFLHSLIKNLFLAFFLFVSLTGCVSNPLGLEERSIQIDAGDAPWIAQFKQTLGQNWYTVKFYDIDVGRASKQRRRVTKSNSDVYQILHEEELLLQIHGTTNKVKRMEIKTFSSTPPYNLLSYDFVENFGKNERSLNIKPNKGDSFDITLHYNGKLNRKTLSALPYSLKDELELEMWAVSATEKGEQKSFKQFLQLMLEFQKIGEIKSTIHSFHQELIDGSKRKIIRVGVENEDKSLNYLDFDDSGVLRSMAVTESGLTYSFQTKKPEFPISAVDLYVHNMVPITQKIGNPQRIKRLHLKIEGLNTKLLENGPTQRVTNTKDNKSILLTIDTDEQDIQNSLYSENLHKYTQLSPQIASEQMVISKMAKEAVGDAIVSEVRIDKLVKYVDKYITNEYIFDSDLQQVLKEKKGDCSEHAMLFTALARSLGIPCRKVSGLVYLGDWCQGFGLHAWNEVYINGRWRAVDASSSSTKFFPIYIRFPDDPRKAAQLIYSAHQMKIIVEEVELIYENKK